MTGGYRPSISVVIPAYNAARFLPSTLESVLAQSYPVSECIVVDDGSVDSIAEEVRLFTVDQHNLGMKRILPGGVELRIRFSTYPVPDPGQHRGYRVFLAPNDQEIDDSFAFPTDEGECIDVFAQMGSG